jgi:hypothetical protein
MTDRRIVYADQAPAKLKPGEVELTGFSVQPPMVVTEEQRAIVEAEIVAWLRREAAEDGVFYGLLQEIADHIERGEHQPGRRYGRMA